MAMDMMSWYVEQNYKKIGARPTDPLRAIERYVKPSFFSGPPTHSERSSVMFANFPFVGFFENLSPFFFSARAGALGGAFS